MFKKVLAILISLMVLPIAVVSVQRFALSPLGSTFFWWLIEFAITIIFLIARFTFFKIENKKHFRFVKFYLIWILICVIRGVFVAEIYWDYKALIGNAFALFLPLIAYIATDNDRLQSILSYFVKYGLILAIPILITLHPGIWGWYLFPVTLLMLFFPILKINWQISLILISVAAILGDITARSHVIKYGFPFVLLLLYYFRFFIASEKIMSVLHKILMIAPIVLFALAVSGIFNVFNFKDYIHIKQKEISSTDEKQAVTQDSRTFIYEEVLNSAIKYDYWLFGRTPARGNETIAFAKFSEEVTGRSERLANEANITNVFTWLGIPGVLLYFLIFYKSSSLAINHSNNIYSKLIGVFVAFRWMYSWVEDIFMFDMNNFVIWIMIGMCLSESFRGMNNTEIKLWVRGIFDINYALVFRYFSSHKGV